MAGGSILTGNSTTSNLGNGGVYTGTFVDVHPGGHLSIFVKADQASATDGLQVQWSTDGANLSGTSHTFTFTSDMVSAGNGQFYRIPILGYFFRVKYTNSTTPQTSFVIQTIWRDYPFDADMSRLNDTFNGQTQALQVRARLLDVIGHAHTANSSTTPLSGSATFTGTAEEVRGRAALLVNVFADQDGTLHVDWSTDGTNWDVTRSVTVLASVGQSLNFAVDGQFFRVRYVNGGAGQGTFRLESASTNMPQYPDVLGQRSDAAWTSGHGTLIALLKTLAGVAHDAVDSGNPLKVGLKAIAHGTNPTAVAALDRTDWYANRAGVPFMIGGHPNAVTIRANYTAAQTDTAIVTVSGGTKIVVTRVTVTADNANTVDVAVVIGFGATNTPTTTSVVAAHPGIKAGAGGGFTIGDGSGILGVGGDGEDLRITSEVPTSGSIDVNVTYYTIES